ncbi:protein CYCLOPS-like [Malus domestica]|uniref:protein CYCLOPS-like n=1 Tax=Malus domestica TaxID=3750 RepID=UPI0010AACBFF|nr:protein CYCLOPS-like [Malus domestica]XP_028953844.1 protein CYCLOPS-like [Malus domestica]
MVPRSQGQQMEGRGHSDFYRNTSEELILRSYMESSVATPLPTMEMLGFKNLSQNFRTDSEELFKSWLTTGETNCYNSSSIAHRTRSRMISTEIASLSSGQQHVGILQKKRSNDCLYPPINTMPDEISGDNNQSSIRHGVERGMQASELYLAKAWFHSSQPMTRSRSSELRRRYVAMQNAQMPGDLEVMQTASGNSNLAKQDFAFSNGFNDPSICVVTNQLATFISPSNSSSSTFNTPQMSELDKVSSVVSMLKGTLELKKLSNQIEKEGVDDDSSNGRFSVQEGIVNIGFDQGKRDQIHEMAAGTFQEVSTIQVNDHRIKQNVEGSLDLEMEGFVNITNPNPISRNSQEPSQSESSAAAPLVSSGFDACDGPSNSSQTLSICESSIKRAGSSRAKDFREPIIRNLKDDQKSGKRLDRYGSVTSAVSVDKEDATKKRRVDRSRKMAEAKERNSTPVIPSDIQSVLKRCENLEKEVRSLKLNLSFMNRKDSEQTKQIEELQKQNEDLMDEKEQLVEEIERVLSETGKI